MKILFVSDDGRHHTKFHINWWYAVLALLILLTVIGFSMLLSALHSSYSKQAKLSKAEVRYIQSFEALMKKTERLEAELQQLKTKGLISDKSQLDSVNHSKKQLEASQQALKITKMSEEELLESIKKSERRLAKKITNYEKLRQNWDDSTFEDPLEFENYNEEVDDANQNGPYLKPIKSFSNPVKTGFISSRYGFRKDPFNGMKKHHNGIDIAAKKGSEIHTIASGFVSFAGRKGGFGKLVEVHHSNSLKSRYAHLDEINVKKGDVVRKGQIIAKMGRTGRATGTHLHLEVWEKDKAVDPISYVPMAFNQPKRSSF